MIRSSMEGQGLGSFYREAVAWLDSVMVSIPVPMIVRSQVQLPAIPIPSNSPGKVAYSPQPEGVMLQPGSPADSSNQIKPT